MSKQTFKVLVLGPPNVGKTSLVQRYTQGVFEENYNPTIGFDVSTEELVFPEGEIKLAIMDLGGQESFDDLRRRLFQGTHYVIIVYDLTDPSTFSEIPTWYETLCNEVCLPTGVFLPGSIVANKADLAKRVDTERGKQMAKLLNLDYFEASAKSGKNVSEIFARAASQCHVRAFGVKDDTTTELIMRP